MDAPTHTVEELEKTIEIWEDKGIYVAMEYFYSINDLNKQLCQDPTDQPRRK